RPQLPFTVIGYVLEEACAGSRVEQVKTRRASRVESSGAADGQPERSRARRTDPEITAKNAVAADVEIACRLLRDRVLNVNGAEARNISDLNCRICPSRTVAPQEIPCGAGCAHSGPAVSQGNYAGNRARCNVTVEGSIYRESAWNQHRVSAATATQSNRVTRADNCTRTDGGAKIQTINGDTRIAADHR